MRPVSARVASVLLLVPLVAGVAPRVAGAQAKPKAADRDLQEIRTYRLTMPKVRQFAQAQLALARLAPELAGGESAAKSPDEQAMHRASEEYERLADKEEPSTADQARMKQLEAEMEQLAEKLSARSDDGPSGAQSLDDLAARIDRIPQAAAAVRSAGLTTREFATITATLLQAFMAHAFTKDRAVADLPKDINPANVQFIRDNEAEIGRLMADLKMKAGQTP